MDNIDWGGSGTSGVGIIDLHNPRHFGFQGFHCSKKMDTQPNGEENRLKTAPEYRPHKHSAFRETRLHLAFAVVTSAVFAITIWFARTTFSSRSGTQETIKEVFKIDVGITLTILRILQGVLSACTTYILLGAFQLIQWTLVSRGNGLSGLAVLALSPTTSFLGTLGIMFSRKPHIMGRIWGLMRCVKKVI
jgi:ABC-type uncharacterized transport system permease subunit